MASIERLPRPVQLPRRSISSLPRRAAAIPLTALLALSLAAPATAASAPGAIQTTSATPVASTVSTATTMATSILTWMNRDRVAAGLRRYYGWNLLVSLATSRAGNMAASGVLSHQTAGGNLGAALNARKIPWYGVGEAIGMTTAAWGTTSAASLYSMWKASAPHRALMMSSSYNYVGIGVVRDAHGTTWASIVFTESPDHTAPVAYNGSLTRSGTTLRFAWLGRDVALQTHTAGMGTYNVEFRVAGGVWRLLKSRTTLTSGYVYRAAHGHYYDFRVQAIDRRGNLSAWTAPKRIWVP